MTRSSAWLVVSSLVLVTNAAACGSTPPAMLADASLRCTSIADCDDHATCTVDTCSASGMCSYTAVDALCTGAGEHCVIGTGCTTDEVCTTAAMCDDGFACTIDSCDVGNVCGHMALDALCTMPGLTRCDASMGCVPGTSTGCATAAECDDEIPCTIDSCAVDRTCRNVAMDSLCTGTDEYCDEALGCSVRHACETAADCVGFYDFCDGDPTCVPEFGCAAPSAPRVCNDGNACTIDSCDPTAGERGACAVACDRAATGCEAEPLCATVGPTCTGNFMITPAPMNNCISGMVSYDMSSAEFDVIGSMLVVTPPSAHFGSLTDATAPVCPTFVATARVDGAGSGGVTEIYTLSGTFSDDDHFTGTFNADLGGIGGILGCTEGSMAVSGTRIP